MRNVTRVKTLMVVLLAGCTQVMAQTDATSTQDPCRKENLLKSDNLANDQLVIFKGVSGTNYSWINWSKTCTSAPDPVGVFVVKVVEGGSGKQVKLQRLSDNKYLKRESNNTISYVDQEDQATVLTTSDVTLPDENTDYLFPTGVSKSEQYTVRFTSEGQHLNIQSVKTNPKFANGVGGYSAQLVYDAKKYIKEALTYNTEKLIGTGAGQYTATEAITAAVNAAKTALANISDQEVTNEEVKTAVEKNKALIDALQTQSVTINTPPTGFYRFRSMMNGKYIANTKTGDKMQLTDSKDNSTVFYYSAESKHLTGSNLINLKADGNDETGLGDTYDFRKQDRMVGVYLIDPSSSNNLYAHKDSRLDRSNDATAPNTAWVLEPVTENTPKLTKSMEKQYATLAAPVALTIPANVKAYTVTATDAKATLAEVTTTIPAGTAVLLEKTGEGTSFNFEFAASATATEGNNNLTGVYVNTDIPAETTAYILGEKDGQYGFYKLNASERNLAANKAYLTLPAAQANLQSIIIGGGTTGIDEIVTGEAAKEVYFDLQGRRVQNPTKGIYVTKSGKKVVFNK